MVKEIRLNFTENVEGLNNFGALTDEFTDYLFSIGAISISYEFSRLGVEFFPEFKRCDKPELYFNVHIPETLNQEKFMLKILSNYNVTFETCFQQLPDIDWVLLSQSTYSPISILNKIWIGTSWHKKPNIIDRELVIIVIDPGQAFGTGTHPTTKLCLEELLKFPNSQKDRTMLDLGCGSGILSIAACKLGFSYVTAIDNDSLALKIAKENLFSNNIDENKCSFFSNIETCEYKFDLVVSNILFSTLIELSSLIVKKLKQNGSLVLSGILKSQTQTIKEKYLEVSQNKILLEEISSEDNWVCLAFFGNNQLGD